MRCKSGRHEWSDKEDAAKCCNGFVRILVFPGDTRWPERRSAAYDREARTWYGRAWLPEAETEAMKAAMKTEGTAT
jgi:hypothetical protein